MSNNKKRQDEKHLKLLRELASQPSNRVCFDCHQRGPTYINMTIGSFVCTTCSGHLRGLNPPHRVKSISMASFTTEEIEQIKSKGNAYCKSVWLGLFDADSKFDLQTKDEQKIKEFMIAKYEKKRFYLEPSAAAKLSNVQSPVSAITKDDQIKSAFKIPAPSSAISRTSAGLSSLPKSNGIAKPVTKSSSVDLLSGILSASEQLEKKNNFTFAPPPSSPSVPCLSGRSENFANFDNANIFSNTPEDLADLSEGFPSFESKPSQDPVDTSSSDSDWEDVSGGIPLIPSGEFPVAMPSLNLPPVVTVPTKSVAVVSNKNNECLRSSSLPSGIDVQEPPPFFGILKSSTKTLLRSVSIERKSRKTHRSSSLSSMSGQNFQPLSSYNDERPSAADKVQSLNDLSDWKAVNEARRQSVESVKDICNERGRQSSNNKHLSAISTKVRARLMSEEGWQAPVPDNENSVVQAKKSLPVEVFDFDEGLGNPRSASPTNITNLNDDASCMPVSNQLTNATSVTESMVKSSPIPFPFSSNPLTPLSTGSPSSPPNVPPPSTSADKYAALKDLDEAFKFQKEKTVKEPTGTDTNFNHQANSYNQSKATMATPNSNWANFDANKEQTAFGSTNPWSTNNSNPFASVQQPTNGSSYNPFL